MEDENGLELSLGLPCGRSSAVSKATNGSSSDTKTDEGDRGSKLLDDFKNFLHDGTQKQDSGLGSQKSISVKPEENFFDNLSNSAINVDASTNLNGEGFWVVNNNRSCEVEEEKRLEAGSKRKNFFDEINHQKKSEREADKTRTSHISITTDEGSTAENEDVADSEAEGSTSRLVPHHDDGSKRHSEGAALFEVPKEVHGVSDSSGLELREQKRFTISSDKEFMLRNVSYGLPFPPQSVNIMNMSYTLPVKEANPMVARGTSNYVLPGMMHVMATSNSERPGNQPVMPANLPLMFGYSPVQLPVLDKDNSRGLVPHSQQLQSSYFGRGPANSDKQDGLKISQATMPVIPRKSSESSPYDGRALELAKGDGKHHATEEGSSSQMGDDVKQSSVIVREHTSDQARAEGRPSEFQAIRQGIAGDVKFGGCGSFPNLPWVSTTGSGPKGRKISGVTYRYSATQIRIVCACHGLHMSPEEFVQHASEEQTNPEDASGLASFASSNPATSTQS